MKLSLLGFISVVLAAEDRLSLERVCLSVHDKITAGQQKDWQRIALMLHPDRTRDQTVPKNKHYAELFQLFSGYGGFLESLAGDAAELARLRSECKFWPNPFEYYSESLKFTPDAQFVYRTAEPAPRPAFSSYAYAPPAPAPSTSAAAARIRLEAKYQGFFADFSAKVKRCAESAMQDPPVFCDYLDFLYVVRSVSQWVNAWRSALAFIGISAWESELKNIVLDDINSALVYQKIHTLLRSASEAVDIVNSWTSFVGRTWFEEQRPEIEKLIDWFTDQRDFGVDATHGAAECAQARVRLAEMKQKLDDIIIDAINRHKNIVDKSANGSTKWVVAIICGIAIVVALSRWFLYMMKRRRLTSVV